jgi:hypothetical protein
MSIEKYKMIVAGLAAKTEEKQIRWKETAEENTFQVSFANYSVTLSAQDHFRRGTSYVVNILNAEGRSVDSFSDNLDGTYEPMAELYEKARRQALGADKALDEILTELKEAR